MEALSRKTATWTYGILLGIANIVISVITFVTSENYLENSTWKTLISLAVFVFFIFYPLYLLKKSNNGYLGLGESIKVGLGISAIAALIGLAYMFIFTNFIDPEMFNKAIEAQRNQPLPENVSRADMEKGLEMSRGFMPVIIYSSIVVVTLFTGLIISLVGGLIFRKERA
jgi:hypothetical protein